MVGLEDESNLVADQIQVTIEAILGDIKLATLEPFDIHILEITREHFVPTLSPVKGTCLVLPECLWILNTLVVGLLVLFV